MMCWYGLGLGRGEADRLDRIDHRGDGDDRQREDDAHAEHGDGDAPGQEAPPPFRVHVPEHGGVDDGIVERQRDFEHAEDEHDPDDAERATAVPVSSQPSQAAEREADGREQQRARIIFADHPIFPF